MAKSKKEEREEYKEFVKQRGPDYAKSLKEIRKSNREAVHGKGIVTRGPNKGLKKGSTNR